MLSWFRRPKPRGRKPYAIPSSEIRDIALGHGGCIASDRITVDGRKVGSMVRDEPLNPDDSGWAFTAGDETQAYLDDVANADVYDVNTIATYDPDIIPFLDAPIGSHFVRWPLDGPLGPEPN